LGVRSPRLLELERLQVVLERLHEALGRVDLAELALDDAEGGAEAVGAAGTDVHLLDDRAVAPPFGNQLRIRPDGVDVRARCVEDRSTRISSSFGVVMVVVFIGLLSSVPRTVRSGRAKDGAAGRVG
jgi:hypothetical protein